MRSVVLLTYLLFTEESSVQDGLKLHAWMPGSGNSVCRLLHESTFRDVLQDCGQ